VARPALISALLAVLALGVLPLDGYAGLVVWTLMAQAALATSCHLVAGIAGQLHLGHGFFFGLGAYTAARTLMAGWDPITATTLAGLGAGLAGLVLSPALVPLQGPAFAIASLSLVLGAKTLAANLEPVTGGTAGLALAADADLAGPLGQVMVVLAATVWIHAALFDSRPGRALRALAADPLAAAGLGLSSHRLRVKVLVTASALAGMIGGIYPQAIGYISPQSAFGLETALAPIVAVMVGGLGTRWGPLWGAVFCLGLQESLFTRGWQFSLGVRCLVLALVGLALPQGLAPIASRLAAGCAGKAAGSDRPRLPF